MNKQLKTRLAILDGAIDKLAVFETGTVQARHVVILQERLRLTAMQWKLECLEQKVAEL